MAKDGKEKEKEDSADKPLEEKKDGGEAEVSKTVLIIIIAAFVLFLAGAGAGFFLLWQKMPKAPAAGVIASPSDPGKEQAAAPGIGPIYSIPSFRINLAGNGGKQFLTIKMELEMKNEEMFEQVSAQFPRVKDNLLTVLSSKTFKDIDTVQDKSALRVELAASVDALFSTKAVNNVYLTDFLVE